MMQSRALATQRTALYPPIEPYRSGDLTVDALHTLYWEECGNPQGEPVLFLHGGPGAGLSASHRQFFDPAHYRIVLFDQRGSGKSTPLGEYCQNTTQLLIQDIEQLRTMLGIGRWLVFGGSWGATLALAYGQAHPENCQGFVLRGIFLGTQAEVDWWLHGMGQFFPEAHAEFVALIPEAERGDLLEAYCRRILSDDPAISLPAARAWSRYEGSCLHLLPRPEVVEAFGSAAIALGVGHLEAHYFRNRCFLAEGELLTNVSAIRHLPAIIVQGRYDVITPPQAAWVLQQSWPEAHLFMVEDAGHSASEPGTAAALVAATEWFKTLDAPAPA